MLISIMPTPLLQIKDLSVDFISNGILSTALHEINITVNKGEIVAIVGESGSGKSVTSLSVLQLLPAPPAIYKKGEILLSIDGKTINIMETPAEDLQNIRGNKVAMIFQEPMSSLNPVLTCGFQVMEVILLHNTVSREEAKQKTIALFNKVQLPLPAIIFHRYPHQLSGGQMQRVMIAMAMSCNPELLICDEPTTALDVTVQKNILLLIRDLQKQNNMGVIFITHDLNIVAEIADRVVVMYRGKIVEENTCETIFKSPKHPYTKALLACRPALYRQGERLPSVSDFMGTAISGKMMEKKPEPKIKDQKTGITEQAAENQSLRTEALQPGYANPAPAKLLSVQHLKVYYPSQKNFFGKVVSYTKAVDNVSFDVYEGETLGLVGESGCGKSTLGRSILSLVKTTGGKIFYKGENILMLDNYRLKTLRKEMQIIFQNPYSSLNPRIKIGDAISEPLKVHGILQSAAARKEKTITLLEKVGLNAGFYHRYPHEFSGGQRQRIVIARALALQPSFVICDESVSALDVSVQAQVLNLLNDLKKEFGFTAIFISHDLGVVRYISNRIIVMQKGKIEETGDAEQIYNRPESAYTQKLIASIPSGTII
jgi:peptide/nickel transport system ATP-binding protein